MRLKRLVTAALMGLVLAAAAPAIPAFADHDCGPPAKHSDHKFDQDDRKKPCK